MRRTRRYQLLYVLALLILAALAFLLYLRAGVGALAAFAVLLLIPGRVGGHYLKGLFRSRALCSRGRFNEAIDAGEAFLADLRRQPWRRRLIFFHYAFYTWDVEAMARNNIGASRMELGGLDQAERELRAALRRDPGYALPYVNLAVIAYVRGDTTEGDRLVSLATEKGYTAGSIDGLISRVGAAYARLQAST